MINDLETKAGKRIAAGFAVFVVVVIGTIIYAFMTKEPEPTSTNEDNIEKTQEKDSEIKGNTMRHLTVANGIPIEQMR